VCDISHATTTFYHTILTFYYLIFLQRNQGFLACFFQFFFFFFLKTLFYCLINHFLVNLSFYLERQNIVFRKILFTLFQNVIFKVNSPFICIKHIAKE